jgi:hypothetical protein
MAERARYASFIVRLWCEPAGEAVNREAPIWMGELESIQTGRAWQFEGLEPLLPLLAGQLVGDSPAADSAEEQG